MLALSGPIVMNTHLVITVHGIRTYGQWQDRLHTMLREGNPATRVWDYKYGYFSTVAFAIPVLRWLATLRFQRALRRVIESVNPHQVDIVAHSFGTYLVAFAIRRLPRRQRERIRNLIFA